MHHFKMRSQADWEIKQIRIKSVTFFAGSKFTAGSNYTDCSNVIVGSNFTASLSGLE